LRILFLILITVILVPTLGFNAFASHSHKHSAQTVNAHKCTYPHTTLYVYTESVQKECVLLMHNGHVVNADALGRPIK
jgi:hypothetical protein